MGQVGPGENASVFEIRPESILDPVDRATSDPVDRVYIRSSRQSPPGTFRKNVQSLRNLFELLLYIG